MKRSKTLLVLALIIVNIIADQITKFWVRAHVEPGSVSDIIGSYFTLHNVENPGAFLGMGSDMNPTLKIIFLLILPVVVLLIALRYLLTQKNLDQWTVVGLSFVIGGGIGNIYDRIIYKQVTDFWHIDFGSGIQTGIFNVADVSVMIGMGCILMSAIVNRKQKDVTDDVINSSDIED